MAGQTRKKVVVYRFEKTPVAGFCDPATGIGEEGIELLSPAGTVQSVPLTEAKVVCFVREFDGPGFDQEMRTFRNRPKTEGLWVRMHFQDNDFLEGIAANNLVLHGPYGLTVTPPEASSNNARMFVPRTALRECRILGIVGTAAAKRRKAAADEQRGLFD